MFDGLFKRLGFFPLIAMYKGGFAILLDTHQNCRNHGLLTDLIYPNFVTVEDRSMLNFIFFALKIVFPFS